MALFPLRTQSYIKKKPFQNRSLLPLHTAKEQSNCFQTVMKSKLSTGKITNAITMKYRQINSTHYV
ncbi:hypothetical protein HMPREF1869_01372 [Bacteroidales bacterium KA00251]|nr:hypothetical protein HMPREF1869_01372 [Bacteroidales bacterium KA00251]